MQTKIDRVRLADDDWRSGAGAALSVVGVPTRRTCLRLSALRGELVGLERRWGERGFREAVRSLGPGITADEATRTLRDHGIAHAPRS